MSQNGKGDTPRPRDWSRYDEGYERIFGARPTPKLGYAAFTYDPNPKHVTKVERKSLPKVRVVKKGKK